MILAAGRWPQVVLGSSTTAKVGDAAAIVGVTEENRVRRQARFEVITVRPADRYQFTQTRGK